MLLAVANGDLGDMQLEWHDQAAVCVVMASEGYPGNYRKGDVINGLDKAACLDNVSVFHAGTADKDGACIVNGGRVLGVTALGATVREAIDSAYKGVECITWPGAQFRTDIGKKALDRL